MTKRKALLGMVHRSRSLRGKTSEWLRLSAERLQQEDDVFRVLISDSTVYLALALDTDTTIE